MSRPLEPTTATVGAREEEKRAFFGRGSVFESYCAADGYRTGERFVFDTFFAPGGTLLDIGCGSGRTSFLLADRFRRIDAFDIVPEMIDFAAAKRESGTAHVRFFVADASALPIPDAAYDNALFSYNGLDSIPTDAGRLAALREIHRVLKPGGRFVFTTKSFFNRSFVGRFHLKTALNGLGLPLFPECRDLAFGEVYVATGDQRVRWHTSNPFAVKRRLREIGFRVLYFNSEVQLGRSRTAPSLRAHFDRWDHFFASEK